MIEDALYYPGFNFQNLSWLKANALFYNRIYRIVPPDPTISIDEDDEVRHLTESGEIGCYVDPVPYSKEASIIFLEKVEDEWNAASLTCPKGPNTSLDRLHETKTDEEVRALFQKMGYRKEGFWLIVPQELASNYMLYMATLISKKNNLSLLTDHFAPWTATNYFIMDGCYDDLHTSDSPCYLYSLILQELTPVNIGNIPSKEILKFRDKRRDEIANLRASIFHLYTDLKLIEDMEIFKDKIRDRLKDVKKAVEDFKNSADIINAKQWFGLSIIGVPIIAKIADFFPISDVSKACVIGTGIALGLIYSIAASKNEMAALIKGSPFSCLSLMEHQFVNYTSRRGGGDINFHAYNCLEEYIND